ncbi:MAG: histidine phosphatase family protein [Rhizobiaceae bacterium]|nr:histidine phosphatase family protein [Rhizobiaceae bacterium]MCV0408791.1 histidine phosphatase family protein [Rhizobiaceae bacterium]
MIRIVLLICSLLIALPAAATEAGWALLRQGGHVVLISHAAAPGAGDPANFDIEDCRTQRNLSEQGRLQARKMGALLAARAAPVTRVLSSRYCRALDTARQAFDADIIEPWPALDSLANNEDAERERSAEVIGFVNSYTGSNNVVLVTHQDNITALTGVRPRDGEAVIVGPKPEGEDGLAVLGRIIFR